MKVCPRCDYIVMNDNEKYCPNCIHKTELHFLDDIVIISSLVSPITFPPLYHIIFE